MAEADISSKKLIGLSPDGWLKWATQNPNIVAGDILAEEFQWISRESDVLIKATSPELGEFIVLNEIQFRPDRRMPRRIRAYTGLAEEKYNLLVYPVLINIFTPRENITIPTRYESEIMGLRAQQDYRVINLWEVDVEIAFQPALTALLPLAPVMKGGGNESVLRRAVQTLQGEERSEDLQRLLGIFATFVLGAELVERVMSLEGRALLESPWGQAILQQGREQGREEGEELGEERGKQVGKQEGEFRILQRQLRRRFGELPESVKATLQQLSVEQLEELADVLIEVNSLDEFVAAIPPAADS